MKKAKFKIGDQVRVFGKIETTVDRVEHIKDTSDKYLVYSMNPHVTYLYFFKDTKCDEPNREWFESEEAIELIKSSSAEQTYKEITGFNSKEEQSSYDLGREHEHEVIIACIKKWDGSTNSHFDQILKKKDNRNKNERDFNS